MSTGTYRNEKLDASRVRQFHKGEGYGAVRLERGLQDVHPGEPGLA